MVRGIGLVVASSTNKEVGFQKTEEKNGSKHLTACSDQVLGQGSRLLSMLSSLWENQEERSRMAMHFAEETFIQVLSSMENIL